MADKAIGDLNFAPGTVDDSNTLFVVQQSGAAYKLSGHEFILALTTILDGHGGISDIEYTAPSSGSLEGTLTITLADQSTTEVTITNGKAISSITQYFAVNNSSSSVPSSWNTTRQTMTSSNRYLWSYFHFAFNDNTSVDTPKSVIGVYGDTGDAWYIWIRYAGQQPTSDSDIGTTPDDWIGIYSGTSSTAPTTYTSYTWYQYKGEKGDTGEASEVTSQSVTYMESSSGTVVPSGSWTSTVPTVTQGNFLWTKTEVVFNGDTQNPLVMYSVSRYGIDGSGSVSSVNNVSPDGTGNITITASDIATSDNNSIQTHLTVAESSVTDLQTDIGDVSTLSGFTATDLTGAANELKTDLTAKAETDASNVSADDWLSALGLGTSGALPITIAQGGTGMTEVQDYGTLADIATAASGVTISTVRYMSWGKIGFFYLTFTRNSSIAGNWVQVAAMNSGKRPAYETGAMFHGPAVAGNAMIQPGGAVFVRFATSVAANTGITISSIFLLP